MFAPSRLLRAAARASRTASASATSVAAVPLCDAAEPLAAPRPAPPPVQPPPPPPPARSFFKRSLPEALVPFASPEGRRMFKSALADGTLDSFFPLVQHFQTQAEPASCAAGSLCMVLNALGVDPGVVWKLAWRWWSEDVLLAKHWEAAQRSLHPDATAAVRTAEQAHEEGMSLAEFGALATAAGLHTTTRVAGEEATLADFQAAVWAALGCGDSCDGDKAAAGASSSSSSSGGGAANPHARHTHTPRGARGGSHVVVSFHRGALAQTGEGHFSPLGGYSRAHAAVLVCDVARFKYPPYWVKLDALYQAMLPLDPATGRPRGFCVLQAPHLPRDGATCPVRGLVP